MVLYLRKYRMYGTIVSMKKQQLARKKDTSHIRKVKATSWSGVAGWYNKLLEQGDDTFQTNVILPNLIRLMQLHKGVRVLDLACGQGFFSRAFLNEGAEVAGVDVSSELIDFAKKQSSKEIKYFVRSADDLSVFKDNYFEKIAIVLAIQNIEAPHKVFKECMRILAPGGRLYLVLNHPAFRIPKQSEWKYDEQTKTQYRRIDRYMSESKAEIDMNPSKPRTSTTISFHRPLQYYFKILANAGFVVSRLEEWNSHRKSEDGPRKQGEDRARMEIPIFLFLEAKKSTK